MWVLRTIDTDSPALFRLLPGTARTVGRATGADFIVDAPLVSRVHCRVVAGSDGSLEVSDLASTNGTFVNGERVERAALNDGDRLTVGRVELIVERADGRRED